jgi:hypothetical protein
MTYYEFETFRTPLLKSKIQRLQEKYYMELEGLGVCLSKYCYLFFYKNVNGSNSPQRIVSRTIFNKIIWTTCQRTLAFQLFTFYHLQLLAALK